MRRPDPTKKRKRHRYVEPGSSWGCLLPVFLGLAGYGLARYQPWSDDWEMVRSWFGQGRHHSIQGEWELTQVLRIKKDPNALIGTKGVRSGTLNFTKDGTLTIKLASKEGEASAQGRYLVSGTLIALNGVQASDGVIPFPEKAKLQLAWTGPDEVVASTATQALYLRKKSKGSNPFSMIVMDLKTGVADKGAGTLRGPVATLQGELNGVNN